MKHTLKRIIAITLIIVLLSQLCMKAGLYAYYLVNVDYISAVLCINKDKADSCCRGKCYLKTSLDKQDKAEQKLPFSIKETTEIIYFSQQSCFTAINMFFMPFNNQLPPYQRADIEAPVFSVFHPPQA